jgi:chromosomal replication initiator protein
MIGTPRSGPSRTDSPRTEIVDYGYRAAAERRDRLLAASSPAVRARILGKPAAVDSESNGLRGEIRELQRKHESLAAEVEQLRRERQELAAFRTLAIDDVAARFVDEVARVGYRIEGDCLTLGHLRSARKAPAWSRPRMVAMWLCSQVAREASLPKVGRYFARDHTTVVYARRQIGRVLKQERTLRAAARATCVALGVEAPAILQVQP